MLRSSTIALLVSVAPLLAATPRPAVTGDAALARGRAAMARLPLRFEANQGQMPTAVRYTARAGAYTLYLTGRGPSLSLGRSAKVDLRLLDSRPASAIEPLDAFKARTDYFVGSRENWRTEIPSYGKVRYRSVYPGVDVVYYGNQNELEYDFVLAPGADPNRIRIRFDGAERVSITSEGDLEIHADGGHVVQKRPFIYQQGPAAARREVGGRYKLVGRNTVAFSLDRYDRNRALVIDPVLSYGTYFGRGGNEQIDAVKLAPNGRLYIAGHADTGDQPYIEGAYSQTNKGLIDIFIAILDTSGGSYGLMYFSYLGGTNNDIPLAIDVDSAGMVYLTGTTTSTDFPLAAAFQTTGAASTVDAFIVKLDPSFSGTDALFLSTYLGGAVGDDAGTGIIAAPDGTIYVIGTTSASDFPVTNSAYQPVQWGSSDAFLCRIDPNTSSVLYATYFGGEDVDEGRAILFGPEGRIYFVISTISQTPPWEGFAYSTVPAGGQEIIAGIVDMTRAGQSSIPYATVFGGTGNDEVRGAALDRNGNLILTGYTLSTDYPLTPDAIQTANNGGGDVFVTVLDIRRPFTQALLYSTYLGGEGGDVAYGVAGGPDGSIYLAGYTLSPDFPVSQNVPRGSWGGGTDLFIAKIRPGVAGRAAIEYSTYLGATGTYVPRSLALAPDGTVFVAGYGNSGLPITEKAVQDFGGGHIDGFVMAISPDPAPASSEPAGGRQQTAERSITPSGRRPVEDGSANFPRR